MYGAFFNGCQPTFSSSHLVLQQLPLLGRSVNATCLRVQAGLSCLRRSHGCLDFRETQRKIPCNDFLSDKETLRSFKPIKHMKHKHTAGLMTLYDLFCMFNLHKNLVYESRLLHVEFNKVRKKWFTLTASRR